MFVTIIKKITAIEPVTYGATERLNRGYWPHFRERLKLFRAQSIMFLSREVSCKVCRCCFFLKSTFSVIIWLICFWRPDCNFQRGVLRAFCPAFCLYSCWIWFAETEESIRFLSKEVSCEVHRCCFFLKSTFSVLFGFLIFWRPDCNFQRGVLKTFCSAFCFTVFYS